MIQESDQDNFRSCLRNFLSGARKKNIKDMSKPFSKIFLRTVFHPVQKMLPYLYWNIFHEKESGTSYQHTVFATVETKSNNDCSYSHYPIMSGGRCRSSLRFTGVFNKPRSIRLVCESSPPRVYCIFARC